METSTVTEALRREVERLKGELWRERQKARALEAEVSTLRTGLSSLRADIQRIGQSHAWRWGHRAALFVARVRRRRVHTQGAVIAALERIERLEEALGALPPSARGGTAAVSPPETLRVPQTADAGRLAAEIRRRLGPPPELKSRPLVSIIVVSHNGLELLQRLTAGLVSATAWEHLELVVVDNGSTDGTREWVQREGLPFPVVLETNAQNSPFADACNVGASRAIGDLLLFANNDLEPFEPGWLHELVAALLLSRGGAVGATLIHAAVTDPDAASGWIIQHAGVRFRTGVEGPRPFNAGDGDDALGRHFGIERPQPAVTAACMLIRRATFEAVGGFPHGYRYGTEDVDLCLQLMQHGHELRCTGRSFVLHRESSSQMIAGREFMRLNRLGNRRLFLHRWAPALRREIRLDRLSGTRLWSDDAPHIAITLTSAEVADGWGDWYTAHEIGDALSARGWRVTYLERKGDQWYDLPVDLDYVLILMDGFDARKVDPGVVTIAWIRNWTERWLERPWFDRLDILLTSSEISAQIILEATGRPSERFPLATNPARFTPTPIDERELDYVFAGNRWGVERALEQALDPSPDEHVALYGRGWEKVPRLSPYARGSSSYDQLPRVYSAARVVLDDTAEPTLPYGAVNARVFDALACETPVITNCEAGVRELFDDDFPVWSSRRTLRDQLDALLADDRRRAELARRYRVRVLTEHTYAHRAARLAQILEHAEKQLSFCIKIGAPSWDVAPRWGDLNFATALRRELQLRGHRALIQVLPEWENAAGVTCDVVIVLRGLSRHAPKPGQLNVLWNISHPGSLTGAECDGYDLVCVASGGFAQRLRAETSTPVMVLEQATDPRVFRPEPVEEMTHELVFVGNSRRVRRKILEDLLPTNWRLAVYGGDWEGIIDPSFVAAEWVPVEQVRRIYSSAGIVLNDHWEDMRAYGFISNRIYDAVACGALVISDRVEGLEERFGEAVVGYDTRDELHALIGRFLSDPEERARRAQLGRRRVLEGHTFAHRVDRLMSALATRIEETSFRLRLAA